MNLSTEPQRRYIEALTHGLTDDEFTEAIGETGHTGWASETLRAGTRNQALKGISRKQASAMIDALKAEGHKPVRKSNPRDESFLKVTEPEPLTPAVPVVPADLLNA